MTAHDDDRRWFKAHPDRTYHVRPATGGEIDDLREHGVLDDRRLAPGCFLFALFKIDRQTTTLEGRIAVLEAGPQWTEAECERAWRETEQGERLRQ